MKKILQFSMIAMLCTVIISISSCSKDPLKVEYTLEEISVCGTVSPNTTQQTYQKSISHAAIITALNNAGVTDLSRVKSAKLDRMKVVRVSGTLDNIDHIDVRFTSSSITTSKQIAYLENHGTGVVEADLTITGEDLKVFLSEDITIYVVITPKTGGIPTQPCFKLHTGVVKIEAKQ